MQKYRKNKSKGKLYYEQLGPLFDKWMSMYDVHRRSELIKSFMPPYAKDLSCLEIGCGTGKISQVIAPLVKSLTVSDISLKLDRKVHETLHVDYCKLDANDLRIPSSFDLIISSECIEHTDSPMRALAEMVRVLRPGGVLIVTSPNKLWYPLLWLMMLIRVRKFDGQENCLFPSQARAILVSEAMIEIKMSGVHLFPWQIPFSNAILPICDKFGKFLYPLMINYGICARKPEN